MASNEDYTLVWVGVYRRTREFDEDDDDAPRTLLEQRARRARLQTWRDTFEIDPVKGEIPCLLIGKQVALLGYKEGRTKFSITPERISLVLSAVETQLRSIGVRTKPQLHVLVHI